MKVSLSTTVLAAALAGSALAAPSGAGAQRQANVEASQAGAGASVSLAQADAQELLRIAIKLNQQGTENEQTRHAKRDLEMHPKGKKFNRVSKDVSKDGEHALQEMFRNGEPTQGLVQGNERRSVSQLQQDPTPQVEEKKPGLLEGFLKGLLGKPSKKSSSKEPSSKEPSSTPAKPTGPSSTPAA